MNNYFVFRNGLFERAIPRQIFLFSLEETEVFSYFKSLLRPLPNFCCFSSSHLPFPFRCSILWIIFLFIGAGLMTFLSLLLHTNKVLQLYNNKIYPYKWVVQERKCTTTYIVWWTRLVLVDLILYRSAQVSFLEAEDYDFISPFFFCIRFWYHNFSERWDQNPMAIIQSFSLCIYKNIDPTKEIFSRPFQFRFSLMWILIKSL